MLRDSLSAKLNVEVTHTDVTLADEEVDVFLHITGMDDAKRTVHPDEVLVIEKGAQKYLTMFYPAVMLADLGETARTIGVAFSCQLRHDLPAESHDRPVHALLVGGEWVLHPE